MSCHSLRYSVAVPNNEYVKELLIDCNNYVPNRSFLRIALHDSKKEFNNAFAGRFFKDLIPLLIPYQGDGRVILEAIEFIQIEGSQTREAINRLFKERIIEDALRADIETPLRGLEQSLSNALKIGNEITKAQQSVIESFVEPYVEVLKERFQGWKLPAALEVACDHCSIDEECFGLAMRDMHISEDRETYEGCSPILDEGWDEKTQNEVSGALYMIGRTLTGLADLEKTLIKTGTCLPSLETQKKIIMALF